MFLVEIGRRAMLLLIRSTLGSMCSARYSTLEGIKDANGK
jgi:hypothetical protein